MLQFITHTNNKYSDVVEGARLALEGGCRWIQLRMKGASPDLVVDKGIALRKLCDLYGAKLIIDDHVELVDTIGADGVHLGKNDMPVGRGPQAPWQRQDNRCHGQYLRRHSKSRRRRGRLHRPGAVPLYTDQRKIIAHARPRGLSQHHGPMCRSPLRYTRRGYRRHHPRRHATTCYNRHRRRSHFGSNPQRPRPGI